MTDSKYWLGAVLDSITSSYPDGEIIVSSGVSPSGPYHIGHLREVLTADAIAYGLSLRGRQARHLHFVDDFDALRKIPADIDGDFEQYLDQPYYAVPAPDGSDLSYADYWFGAFNQTAIVLTKDMEVIRSHEQYQAGKFAQAIELALAQRQKVSEIIEQVSGRQLAKVWAPVQILSDSGKLNEWTFVDIDAKSGQLSYRDKSGQTGKVSYKDGRVKLDWRLDWPARWWIWGVQVEPFGRDHATRGGSYDTGKALIKAVYQAEPPQGYAYEFINLKGQTKKMSASSGGVISPAEALALMPPQLLRYFVLKSRPSLQLFFDTGQGFGRLYDEYRQLEQTTEASGVNPRSIAAFSSEERVLSDVPFNHLVTARQSANHDDARTLAIIARSEHTEAADKQKDLILREAKYIDIWLDKWAPEEVKFSVQEQLGSVELSQPQTELLDSLAEAIAQAVPDANGQWFHERIYEQKDRLNLTPNQAFSAIYRVILGQDQGPQAGWFLATLDREWLVRRLRREA